MQLRQARRENMKVHRLLTTKRTFDQCDISITLSRRFWVSRQTSQENIKVRRVADL